MNTLFKILLIIIILFALNKLEAQLKVETITQQFNGSGGLTIGSDGLLYIANFGESLDNGRGTQVWKLDYENGGQPVLFAQGLNGASGNDFDSAGNLFQSNIASGTVSKITQNGQVSLFVSAGISCNVGINIDSQDNLYICNCCGSNQNTIRKVTKNGISTQFAASSLFFCPNGITRDKNDNLYISNFSNGNVVKVNSQGQASLFKVIPGGSNGHIIYSEKEDVLYVASHGSHKIYKLKMNGVITVLAGNGQRGNKDGDALSATFSRPNGLALSVTEDTLFVNSSIPVTNAGGRPLNPSVIRMITGLRSTTSTDDINDHGLEFIHNRDGNKIHIRGIQSSIVVMNIFNVFGMLFYSEIQLQTPQEIEIAIPLALSRGVYLLSIQLEDGQRITEKFMISQ